LVSVVMTSSPGLAGLHRLQGRRVDHLEQEMVLPAVQPVACDAAFDRHARPDDFRQPVEVDRRNAEPFLQIAAHLVAPRLGAENADSDRQRTEIDAHAFRDFGDVERVGRRRADDARAEVLQQRHLPLGQSPDTGTTVQPSASAP
jgi:hypothetical protein